MRISKKPDLPVGEETIEPGIRPLVDMLNTIEGVTTNASCQGHWFTLRKPLVMFESDVKFSAELSTLCSQNGIPWDITVNNRSMLYTTSEDEYIRPELPLKPCYILQSKRLFNNMKWVRRICDLVSKRHLPESPESKSIK